MNLLIDLPVEVVAQLLSSWLKVPEVCKIEVVLCSPQLRTSLLSVYESSVLELNVCRAPNSTTRQVDWYIRRGVKISKLHARPTLTPNDCDKVVVLLSHSTSFVTSVTITGRSSRMKELGRLLLRALVTCCHHLRYFQIENCELSDTFWCLLSASTVLVDLIVCSCTVPLGPWASSWNARCPSVQTLNIVGKVECKMEVALQKACSHAVAYYRDKGLFADMGYLPHTLQVLIVKQCEDTSMINGRGRFALSSGLKYVSITSSSAQLHELDDMAITCPRLTYLDLSNIDCFGFDEQSILNIGNAYGKTLKSFLIANCACLTEDSLRNLCTKCVRLRLLDISRNNYLPDSVYATILDCLPNLRCLHLQGMSVSDTSLRRIAQSSLRGLNLTDTTGYTVDGLMALVEGCTCLKFIAINSGMVNASVKRLWAGQRPDLSFVDQLPQYF